MQLDTNQLTQEIMSLKLTMAELNTNVKHIQKKIDENAEIGKGLHSLTSTVASLTQTIENLTEKFQGDITYLRDKLNDSNKRFGERIEALEKEPANKWKTFMTTVGTAIVSLAIGALIMYLTNGGGG